jgi:hypothetical protein
LSQGANPGEAMRSQQGQPVAEEGNHGSIWGSLLSLRRQCVNILKHEYSSYSCHPIGVAFIWLGGRHLSNLDNILSGKWALHDAFWKGLYRKVCSADRRMTMNRSLPYLASLGCAEHGACRLSSSAHRSNNTYADLIDGSG